MHTEGANSDIFVTSFKLQLTLTRTSTNNASFKRQRPAERILEWTLTSNERNGAFPNND